MPRQIFTSSWVIRSLAIQAPARGRRELGRNVSGSFWTPRRDDCLGKATVCEEFHGNAIVSEVACFVISYAEIQRGERGGHI